MLVDRLGGVVGSFRGIGGGTLSAVGAVSGGGPCLTQVAASVEPHVGLTREIIDCPVQSREAGPVGRKSGFSGERGQRVQRALHRGFLGGDVLERFAYLAIGRVQVRFHSGEPFFGS
ncbi:hypothetical protein [Nocardia abscessus]|uniref:hypothetical protein n=1 Tax=Nocardia abscessus TaxID=120957 RepID=UPI002457C35A|nr:hypothetical protein [Nocardia abscessus]